MTSAGIATLWGFILLLPPPTFAVLSLYAGMSHVASEGIWGLAMVAGGCYQMFARATEQRAARLRAAAIMCALWGFVAGFLVYANPLTTAAAVYPSLAILNIWAGRLIGLGVVFVIKETR
jgi:hypothetical protein